MVWTLGLRGATQGTMVPWCKRFQAKKMNIMQAENRGNKVTWYNDNSKEPITYFGSIFKKKGKQQYLQNQTKLDNSCIKSSHPNLEFAL